MNPQKIPGLHFLIFAAGALGLLATSACSVSPNAVAQDDVPRYATTLSFGWQLLDAPRVPEAGAVISSAAYAPKNWYKATVPGTVLTSLVNDGVYPEPLYGENNRPDKIPEYLSRMGYWYRTQFTAPTDYAGRQVWLNFAGINYTAEVWLNGIKVGDIRGAFARGIFNVTELLKFGASNVLAVKISSPPDPSNHAEKTIAAGTGVNGGILSKDGPTFICTQGWDWIPVIRDRDVGIWQNVTLTASGPVVLLDPYVYSHLPLPRTDSADVSIEATVQNVSNMPQTGVLRGKLGDVAFEAAPVTLQPKETQTIKLSPENTPVLHLQNPHLWWPNGFGDPFLYPLHLSFDIANATSDTRDLNVGIREITYALPGSDNLAISVNGVPVFAKGGDWGIDEAMKREPRERLEAQIRYHREANYTMIRNWVGQSTSEDFYDLCDKYGIMLWDEFFQPNPSDSGRTDARDGSQDIPDIQLYLANAREKVLRYRNHPSIALWCGRNEGDPSPQELADGLSALFKELDPNRLYHPNSNDGAGVRSGGPYSWRTPEQFYTFPAAEAFKTELGSVSIPTLDSIHAMMPEKDWWPVTNDDWAEHDLTRGAQEGRGRNTPLYVDGIGARYGTVASLPDFARKAQLTDYETFRAMYEGRFAKLFAPTTAVLTWMSNPAQPSTVWQIYSYDLEPFGSFFGVKKACEPIHVQMNQSDFHVMVINQLPQPLIGLTARVRVYNLDGTLKYDQTTPVATAPGSAATDAGAIAFPDDVSAVHFVKLELRNSQGKLLSENFYWRGVKPDDLTALDTLPDVALGATIARRDANGQCVLDVTLTNPAKTVALMAHLQLRKASDHTRVLPVDYSDNYISLLPGETRTISISADSKDLGDDQPLVTLDGWNTTTDSKNFPGASIAANADALVKRPTPAN
jgi:hypothetical protein